ncbi:lipid binding protein [Pelomyxa schiedti]|nr:lipid binding protein [Pelomyxa schiedti]
MSSTATTTTSSCTTTSSSSTSSSATNHSAPTTPTTSPSSSPPPFCSNKPAVRQRGRCHSAASESDDGNASGSGSSSSSDSDDGKGKPHKRCSSTRRKGDDGSSLSPPPSSAPTIPYTPMTINFPVPHFPGGALLRKANGVSKDGDPQTWTILQGPEFKVRTLKYLSAKKKAPSDFAGLNVFSIDLVRCKKRIDNISSHPANPLQTLLSNPACPHILVFNHQVLMDGMYLHLLIYAALPETPRLSDKARQLLQQFESPDMTDATRNVTLKMIPSVVVGPWLAKKAVGNKPALVGTKLACKYFRGTKYFEICLDVGSTSVGTTIIGVINKYVKSLVVDLAFLLEGKSEAQLPEQLLCGIRMYHCDLEYLMREVPLWDPL